jgi:5-hydroxyisourate hydrolase
MSQLTTHILDTSSGKPAQGVLITLYNSENEQIAKGITNADGRITDLLPEKMILNKGVYKLIFESGSYFASMKINTFYPRVQVEFEIKDDSHYHVPLLLNPYGYSTYRGS